MRRTQRSMLICLSGIDGSGKTSLAQALEQEFKTRGVRTKVVWTRGSIARWLNPFKYAGEIVLRSSSPEFSRDDRLPPKQERIRYVKNRWLRLAYQWIIFLELLLFYTKHVRIALLLGVVVICDRYVVDHLVDWADQLGDPQAVNGLPARLLTLLTPKPDLGILLDIHSEVVNSRRDDELSTQFIDYRIRMLRNLSSKHWLKCINADRPFEEVCDEVRHLVLRCYNLIGPRPEVSHKRT